MTNYRLDKTLEEDPERWPIFYRASKDLREARGVKIEWLVNDGLAECECCGEKTKRHYGVEYNYMQIFRVPFNASLMNKQEAYAAMLDTVEKQLQFGVRDSSLPHWALTGGVYDLLGRWPRKTDRLALYVLRSPVLLAGHARDGESEWVCEVGLQAIKDS